MQQLQHEMALIRADTNARLDAERASADVSTEQAARAAQRALDDLIERDRIRADEQLWSMRRHADSRLARERSASPLPSRAVVAERGMADQDLIHERTVTDALLTRERERADAAVAVVRQEAEDDRASLNGHRQDTDEQLLSERAGVDSAVSELVETTNALASAGENALDVLGMVTHDLRSPLCVMTLNSQWIAESSSVPAVRQAAEEVVRAGARMERLLSDLLDVARIESGTFRVTLRRDSLRDLLTEVRQSYEPLCAARGITLDVSPEPAADAVFDYDRVVQVLSNLLSNALKFTPSGGTVTIGTELRGDAIELFVRNSGEGIAADALPHIFQRFWQIDSDTRRGLGLGLHICEKIITAHGGRIFAESQPGEGATFRFTLPTR